jgi:hypothetical protein
MKKYGKAQNKYHLSVYVSEAQHDYINECVEKYGMTKNQIALRLMFANGTSKDPRYFNR